MAEDHSFYMSSNQETCLQTLISVGIKRKPSLVLPTVEVSNAIFGWTRIKNHKRHTISAKGCLPYGASCSMYWKTGDNWLPDSLSSLVKPSSWLQILSAEHRVVTTKDLSLSLSLLVSGALSPSLSSPSCLQLKIKGTTKYHRQKVNID